MVRERVGDWRSAWRLALAGLVASALVIATSQTTVVAPLYFALQDQLFPVPAPSPQVTLVALDSTAAADAQFGPFPWRNTIHAQVINYLASLHPKVILFDVMLDHSDVTGDGDTQLAQAIANAGHVVLVCTADDSPRPEFANQAAAVAGRELGVPDAPNAVRGVPIKPAKTCAENTRQEAAFVQALRIAERINSPLIVAGNQAHLGKHDIPLVNGEMLVNFTNGALQGRLAAKGLPPISWGIGVNTGPAVLGNMGSKDRLQYTALGDTVNTAARFCSVAPAFTLLIGQMTLDACTDYIAVEQVPGLQLKGKSAETFRVFQVVSIRQDANSQWVPFPTEAANEAYTAIRRQHASPPMPTAQTPDDGDVRP